ncbi:hypothetical protein NOGI109294_21170 [Nocardiopsis gilva]|uniref:hypothetical protein n=1 Tax=Nocardiopsis gilva TaxID=280236 RepID=UPI00034A5713|nr:hypothetical protein [Nocardiopsis gilva]
MPDLRQRGWSPAMIRDLLGEPDHTRPNPIFRSGAPMALYRVSRVEDAEAGSDFTRRAEQAARRAAAARHNAQRRRDATLEMIRAAPIDVPDMDRRLLAERAVAHRNRRVDSDAEDPGLFPFPARVEDVPTAVRHRWEVNYLRHARTPYDSLLADLRGRVGRVQAELLLRRRIYAAIAACYPDLSEECDRQLARRIIIDRDEPP